MALTRKELADLVVRVGRDRDRQAFSVVYDATSAKLYGIILRILHRRDLADEILQDVYVKIWEKAASFDPARASPITWMATLARNRAIDEVRRAAPVSLEDVPEVMDIADGGEHPIERLERSEDYRRLLECLEGLDKDRREMVLLAYYRGVSRDELARRFGRPVATVKTWLYRSLSQLRDCLGS